MIQLNTPIVLYPDIYNGLFIVRAEVELRNQSATFFLAPVRADEENIYLGVKETVDGRLQYRFPELLYQVTVQQNPNNPDPVIDALFRAWIGVLEQAEAILVANQQVEGGLATRVHQIGTTQWSLASSFVPNGERAVSVSSLDAAPPPPIEEEIEDG